MGLPFRKKKDMPSGLWDKCQACGKMVYKKELQESHGVCPVCGHHHKILSAERLSITLDEGSFEGFAEEFLPRDVLEFSDREPYDKKIVKTQQKTGLSEAAIVGTGTMNGLRVVIGLLDFSFFGGSMGQVVGERIAVAVELALEEKLPLIVFSASGGARMQEGALSLMQMAKTSAAIGRLREDLTASFAALGDFILAEPGALIGFAGPRVIKTTLRTDLPEGFQTSEFLLEHGFIDRVVPRQDMREELSHILEYCLT
jgi:acetyl-CoA carboxylase carboxyl transferase subunit beta